MHKNKHLSHADFWAMLITKYESSLPNMVYLGKMYLLLPPTTVDAERGFSRQNLIKTALRSNMTIKSLDRIMMLKIEGKKFDDYDRTFEVWCCSKDRRLFQQFQERK